MARSKTSVKKLKPRRTQPEKAPRESAAATAGTDLVSLRDSRPVRRLALLTGGGDCPGLNAVIRAIVKTAIHRYGIECYGIEDGFHGLIYRRARPLTSIDVSGILNTGGTMLGSSNKDNPFTHRMRINGKEQTVDLSDEVLAYVRQMGWDCVICIGGDGTLTMANQLSKKGMNVIGVPKTIDNDLSATDYTFGFATAVQTAVEAIDRLHTTAMSHHRVQVIEMMGRYAGHLALEAGVAGGGDIILIPEIPYSLDKVCEVVLRRSRAGKRFSIIVVAEGAKPLGGDMVIAKMIKESPDPVRLGGIANILADQIMKRTHLEARATVLGHLQRGGAPIAVDRILSTRFGHMAAELAVRRRFGSMVALQGRDVVEVTLEDAVHRIKPVALDSPLLAAARAIGTSFGESSE